VIEFASRLDLNSLRDELFYWGYRSVDVVEGVGEVSFRGDIVDIFPSNLSKPIRISLFDDEVESIREFECETQKSYKDELESIEIFPAVFALNQDSYESINQKIQTIDSDSFEKDIHSLGLWALGEFGEDYLKAFRVKFAKELQSEIEEIALFDKRCKTETSTCRRPCHLPKSINP